MDQMGERKPIGLQRNFNRVPPVDNEQQGNLAKKSLESLKESMGNNTELLYSRIENTLLHL